jgi:hypothetical protein
VQLDELVRQNQTEPGALDLLRRRPPRTARTTLTTVGHCMLPAVDATLHRAVETSLTAAWRGAVRLGRDDGDGIEGNTHVRRLHQRKLAAQSLRSAVGVADRLTRGVGPRTLPKLFYSKERLLCLLNLLKDALE